MLRWFERARAGDSPRRVSARDRSMTATTPFARGAVFSTLWRLAAIAVIAATLLGITLFALDFHVPPTFATDRPGWRLLFDGGGPHTVDDVRAARNQSELERLWRRHTGDPPPAIDFDRELVVDFEIGGSSTCRQALTAIEIDEAAGTISPASAFGPPDYGRRGCTGDYALHWFVVALDRSLFPTDRVALKRGEHITRFTPAVTP